MFFFVKNEYKLERLTELKRDSNEEKIFAERFFFLKYKNNLSKSKKKN